jgi:hypothetical protein
VITPRITHHHSNTNARDIISNLPLQCRNPNTHEGIANPQPGVVACSSHKAAMDAIAGELMGGVRSG